MPVDPNCDWVAFEDIVADYDPVRTRLCAPFEDPRTDERHDIDCRLEGLVADSIPPPTDALTVMTYNMERNIRNDAQVEAFETGLLPMPDIILASEVDRGCGRSDKINGGLAFAEALGLNYAFGVEFVELVGPETDTPCEHGQAIFSRYPLGNVNLFRHEPTGNDEWDRVEQPRVGTRVDLEADVLVGNRCVHVVSVHYDDALEEEPARVNQAMATAARGLSHEGEDLVIGGDMNTAFYFADLSPAAAQAPAARAFWDAGYVDTHASLDERETVPFEVGGIVVSAVVDLLWVLDETRISNAQGCTREDCGELSDHLPQWFTYTLPTQ